MNPLDRGLYTVSQTCRVLRPSMTSRKVHYWLDTDLLGSPVRWGGPGVPTLLSFEQVLKIRTLQHLRDELRFTLQEVRRALAWLLDRLVREDWHRLIFVRSGSDLAISDFSSGESESFVVPGGQGVLSPLLLDSLNAHVDHARSDWERRAVEIAGYPHLLSSARILGGSPVIRGTRVETAFIAHLASELPIAGLDALFPDIGTEALREAADFEGVLHAA